MYQKYSCQLGLKNIILLLTMLELSSIILIMNRLKREKQAQIISVLVEGNSIRATRRITGAAKGTVLKLLADVGKACSDYQNKVFRNLSCKKIQCDEIWAFCYAKEKNEVMYSASRCIGAKKNIVSGNPKSTSTSFVERQNLTMRMSMRR